MEYRPSEGKSVQRKHRLDRLIGSMGVPIDSVFGSSSCGARGSELTTISQAFWPSLDYLRARGERPDALIAQAGYTEADLREPDRRVPRSSALTILRALQRIAPDPALGFTLSTFVNSQTFDLLEYMARASATLGDAILVASRYARIVDDSCQFSLQNIDQRAIWRLEVDWPRDVEPLVVEFVFGVLGMVGSRLFGGVVPLKELWVRWGEPAAPGYVRAFGFPVRFRAPYNAILYPPGVLEAPLRGFDPALGSLLQRQAETLLARLPCLEKLSEQVKGLLAEELRGGEPSMRRIARRLGTTPSTLRRRLCAEGTSFKHLLEATRLEVARACLADPRLSINETAFLLGYSDASTFFKFFRRGTGITPAQYRKVSGDALRT